MEASGLSPEAPEPTDRNEVRQKTVDSDLSTFGLGLAQPLEELKAQSRG